jgi:hypothetical protein
MRVMGGDVAELPLVATSQDVQGLVGLRIALTLNTRLFILVMQLVLCSLVDV